MADDYGAQPPAPQPTGSNVRIYVGNLPPDSSKRDLEQLFEKYGTLMDVSIKRTVSGTPFAFIEFEDERDAQEAIKGRDGYNFNGNRLRVEIPFASRSNGPNRGRGRAAPRRGEYRVQISGLPASGSWQDLKDHMRDAGECVYADVFRDGTGIVEFTRRDDWEYALKQFNDSKFRSHEGETSRIQVRVPDDMRDYSRRSPSPHSPHGRDHYDGHRGAGRDEYRGGGGGYRDDNRSWGGHRDEYSSRGYRGDDRGGYRDDYRGAGASYRPDSRGGGGTPRYGSGGGGRYQDDMPPRYDSYRRDAPRHEEIPRGRSRSRSRR